MSTHRRKRRTPDQMREARARLKRLSRYHEQRRDRLFEELGWTVQKYYPGGTTNGS